QIQPELVVPIAYWIGSELSQQEFEIEKRNDPFKSNLSGWVIVDPVQTPCEREIIVGELMHKAFSPLHLGRDQTFLSAGIHSLNILELRMLIQKKLKITVTYEQIHTLGTQRLISAWLRYAPSCCDSILEEYIYDGLEIPANKAQKAIFVAANTHSSQTAYNVPIVLEIERSFDASIIYNALLSLVERHLALRATFFIKGDDLFQRINSRVRLPFIIRNLPSNELEKAMYSFRQPFDILRGPLIRACLFETYENYRTLLLDFHHLIIDGISMQIFISEFCSLLQGKVLEPVDDYIKTIVEENVYTKSESTRVDNAYWNNLVEKPLKATRLTTAGLVGVNGGECIKVEIANSLINTIQSVVTTHETTLHVFFLSTLHVLLAKLLKEDSTVVGVPFSGRAMATNLNVVGMFAQTLPSRHTISNSHKFNELLDTVAAEHLQHMMFRGNNIWHWENLKDPGFSIVFTSHRFNFDLKGIGRWRAFYYPESHFDLLIYLVENDSKFELHFEYDCSKFDRNTIQYYADAFLNLAEQFASEPAKVINRASLFSPIQTVTWRNQTNPSIGYDQLTGSVIDRWNQSVQDW
ncbi:TPA: condensation domain-containing protein, partial [Acinetobacter baumannii]